MDGHCLNKIEKYLTDWLELTVKESKWGIFPNIHIDEISQDFKAQNTWINASLCAYKYLNDLLKNRPYRTMLVISLTYEPKFSFKEFKNFIELESNLYLTPPALYIEPSEHNSFKKTLENSNYVLALSKEVSLNVYYKIEKEDDEFSRTIFVTSESFEGDRFNTFG